MEGNSTVTNNDHNSFTNISSGNNSSSYARSGKVMMSSVVITFSVVIIIVFIHSYARCIFLRRQRRRLQLQSHSDPASAAVIRGLDSSVVKNLPTFLHSVQRDSPLECAVCLSEFEEQEKGRVLPTCGHKFHVGCIDMWFFSHSNCPLCRSSVVILQQPDSLSSRGAKDSQDFVSISLDDDAQLQDQSRTVANEKGSSSSSSSSSPSEVVISVEQTTGK